MVWTSSRNVNQWNREQANKAWLNQFVETTRRQEQQAKKKQFLPSTFQWSPDIEEKYKKQGLFLPKRDEWKPPFGAKQFEEKEQQWKPFLAEKSKWVCEKPPALMLKEKKEQQWKPSSAQIQPKPAEYYQLWSSGLNPLLLKNHTSMKLFWQINMLKMYDVLWLFLNLRGYKLPIKSVFPLLSVHHVIVRKNWKEPKLFYRNKNNLLNVWREKSKHYV